jgi:hypothetical protein
MGVFMPKIKIYNFIIYTLLLIVITFISLKFYKEYNNDYNKSIITSLNQEKIEPLSHLSTIKVELSDLYEKRTSLKKAGFTNWHENYIKGLIRFKGTAKIGINLSNMNIKIIDKKRKIIKITLPAPEIIFLKLHTKMFDEIDWQDIKSQDKVNFIKYARINAKKNMREELEKDKVIKRNSVRLAKKLLKNFYNKLGWDVIFNNFNTSSEVKL